MKKYVYLFSFLAVSTTAYLNASLITRENIADFMCHDNGTDTLQLRVANQFARKNGGADCGHESLYNGIKIRELLLKNSDARKKSLKDLESDIQERTHLFGTKESPWKSHVISTSDHNTKGNWLESDDMLRVLRDKAFGSNSAEQMKTIFITGNNVLQPDAPLSNDPLLFTSKDFLQFLDEFQADTGTATATFYVYLKGLSPKKVALDENANLKTVTQNATVSYTYGHWVCMIAHRVGADRQFILANSAENRSLLDHYRIKELKALLIEEASLDGVNEPAYVRDKRFETWVEAARPPAGSLQTLLDNYKKSSHYKFAKDHPVTTRIIAGIVIACFAKYFIDRYQKKSEAVPFRSQELILRNCSSPAVH